jgi:hypothetical protein
MEQGGKLFAEADFTIKANGHEALALGEWNAGLDVDLPPPRGWLLGNSFCRRSISSLLADGGVGKSALRHLQAISLASGRKLTGEHVFQRTRVLIISLEDDADELRRRVLAVRLHHKVTAAELDGWLYLATPGANVGKLMTINPKTGALVTGTLPTCIEAAVMAHDIGLVILDPFIKAHSVAENQNVEMDAVAQLLSDMAAKYDLAIDLPHHVSKGPAEPGNANRGRGASATKDAGRLVYTLSPMSPEESARFNIAEDERRAYVRLDRAKLNIARTSGPAIWFKLIGVALGNASDTYPAGDEVQTVEVWHPPDAWAGTSTVGLNAILSDISRGMDNGQRYSNAPNAAERMVWPVVQKHYPDKPEGQCREIIHAWLATGLLYPKEYADPVQYKPRKGLYVDDTKRPS